MLHDGDGYDDLIAVVITEAIAATAIATIAVSTAAEKVAVNDAVKTRVAAAAA